MSDVTYEEFENALNVAFEYLEHKCENFVMWGKNYNELDALVLYHSIGRYIDDCM